MEVLSNTISYVITRSMIYKSKLPKEGHVFYIAKLRGKRNNVEVCYQIRKAWEDEVLEVGVKEAIIKKLESEFS